MDTTTETIEDFAKRRNIDLAVSYRGETVPPFGESKMYEWACTLTYGGKQMHLPYWCGMGWRRWKTSGSGFGADRKIVKPGERVPFGLARTIHNDEQVARFSEPGPPTVADVLGSLQSDDVRGASFEEWAGDLGYDPDSRKALDTYLSCQEQSNKLRALLGAAYNELLECEPR